MPRYEVVIREIIYQLNGPVSVVEKFNKGVVGRAVTDEVLTACGAGVVKTLLLAQVPEDTLASCRWLPFIEAGEKACGPEYWLQFGVVEALLFDFRRFLDLVPSKDEAGQARHVADLGDELAKVMTEEDASAHPRFREYLDSCKDNGEFPSLPGFKKFLK